jgi:hypothetical protein
MVIHSSDMKHDTLKTKKFFFLKTIEVFKFEKSFEKKYKPRLSNNFIYQFKQKINKITER